MKYIIISILIVLFSIILPIIGIKLLERKKCKKIHISIKIISCILTTLIILTSVLLIYASINYKATIDTQSSLKSTDTVTILDTKDYYFFDNKNNDEEAIIFYGGAKVEEKAYAPLIKEISESGIDVYIMKMPFYIALLSINKADIIMQNSNYKNVYLMGHSLGGMTASLYLSNTSYNYKGIIFLASYPNKELNSNISSLSIYGSLDKVLNIDNYNKNKNFLPNTNKELVIDGGNHSFFGNYGRQKNDGVASITRLEQQTITKDEIINFIKETK